MVILEKDCTAQRLMEEITALIADSQRRRKMHTALQKMAVPDSAERICGILEELAASEKE